VGRRAGELSALATAATSARRRQAAPTGRHRRHDLLVRRRRHRRASKTFGQPVPAETVRRAASLCAISPCLDLASLVADVLRALRSAAADVASVFLEPLMWVARLLLYVLSLIERVLGVLVEGLFGAWGW
jgi:hypothetical protein